MTDRESWQNIRTVLQKEYVEPSAVEHRISIQRLFNDDRIHHPNRQIAIVDQLEDLSQSAINFDDFRGLATNSPKRGVTLLLLSAILVDITCRFPNIEHRAATRSLNQALAEETSVTKPGKQIIELVRIVSIGDAIREDVEPDHLAHPDDDLDKIEHLVTEEINSGDLDKFTKFVKQLQEALNRDWTRNDLLTFDGYEFETLLARCWRDQHNAAKTTQKRQDKGVDVIVRTRGGERLLVQTKRKSPSYNVGVKTVQRTNGTLEEFGGDRAVVVTSSSFTQSAQETADSIDRLSLVNGKQVCEWLNSSSLIPPLSNSL